MRLLFPLLVACATTPATSHPRPTTGGIAGLARDHDSGEVVSQAAITVRVAGQPRVTSTNKDGHYVLTALPPGEYRVAATFAGQTLEVAHVAVKLGDPTIVDLTFTLGRPGPVAIDYNDAKLGAIDHYKPPHLGAGAAIVEGSINDNTTFDRIAGATVSVFGPAGDSATTQLGVSDGEGRFHFDVLPGVYTVSAYYNVNERQIEARRSEIHVDGAEAVIVPLWIEAQR